MHATIAPSALHLARGHLTRLQGLCASLQAVLDGGGDLLAPEALDAAAGRLGALAGELEALADELAGLADPARGAEAIPF